MTNPPSSGAGRRGLGGRSGGEHLVLALKLSEPVVLGIDAAADGQHVGHEPAQAGETAGHGRRGASSLTAFEAWGDRQEVKVAGMLVFMLSSSDLIEPCSSMY